MKKVIIILSLLMIILNTKGQNNDSIKLNFRFDFGLQYIPIEYISGIGFGLVTKFNKIPININFRKEIYTELGKDYDYDSISGTLISKGDVKILRYFTKNYVILEYEKKLTNSLILIPKIGYGYIFSGESDIHLFSPYTGYSVIPIGLGIKYSWVTFNINCDIPIRKSYHDRYNTFGRFFPVSFGISKRFTPKLL